VKIAGEYWLYYTGRTTKHGTTWFQGGLAMSSDLDDPGAWKKHPENPIISTSELSQIGVEANVGLPDNSVVYDDRFGFLHTGNMLRQNLITKSRDGLNFVPVKVDLFRGPSGAWDDARIMHPTLAIVGGCLRMYYTGYDGTTCRIGFTQVPVHRVARTMELISQSSLGAGSSTAIGDCRPIDLQNALSLSVTAECTYDADATDGLRIHLRTSPDGDDWDTADLDSFDNEFTAGETERRTVQVGTDSRFLRVVCENLDGSVALSDLKVRATVKEGEESLMSSELPDSLPTYIPKPITVFNPYGWRDGGTDTTWTNLGTTQSAMIQWDLFSEFARRVEIGLMMQAVPGDGGDPAREAL